jgi:DNA-directed RNA polymerase I, II, and III subunit RPABC2
MPPKKTSITKRTPTSVSTAQESSIASASVVSSTIDEQPPPNPTITASKVKGKGKTIDKQSKKQDLVEVTNTEHNDEVLVDTSKITPASIGSMSAINTTTSTIKIKKSAKKTDDQKSNFDDDDNIDYRTIMLNYDFTKNKTRPIITKYEKALLVGKRAKQIESGALSNVKVLAGQNAIQIAEEELRQRKIPLLIKRPIGNKFEYWKPVDMEVDMD